MDLGARGRQGDPLKRYEELRNEAESDTDRRSKNDIVIPPGARLGATVVEAQNVSKGYGDRLLIEDLSFKLPPGGIVGVIGPNGAGKTTLFRMIMGKDTTDSGALNIGDSVQMTGIEQMRDALDAD